MEQTNIFTAAAIETRAAFSCDPAAMQAAAKYLNRWIVPARNYSSSPFLDWLHVEARPDGAVILSAWNSGQGASITVPAAVDVPGAFCAEAGALVDVLAKVRKIKGAHEVHFADGDRLTVRASRARFQLFRHAPDDFPLAWALPAERGGYAFDLPAARLFSDLGVLDVCASREEHRPYLNGVALQVNRMAERDRLTFIATDGFAMAIASRDLPAGAEDLPEGIIPNAAVMALHAARKLDGVGDVVRVELTPTGGQAHSYRFTLGALRLWTKAGDGTFVEWQRPQIWIDVLSPTGGQAALFPDLLPGARLSHLDKIAKAAGPVDWEPCAGGLLGTVPGDDGIVFGVINGEATDCGRKGFAYWGGSEIIGPDGVTYPVAYTETAIHLSKEQVRALIGESCFETMAVAMPDGRTVHILQWLWDQGDGRFLTVRPDGRCYGPKDAGRGEYLTRADIEAALASEPAPVAAPAAVESESDPAPAHDAPEWCEALHGPECTTERGAFSSLEPDPVAALAARVAALEARVAALPVETAEAPTAVADRPRRTPAHERAIRRAWAERASRRRWSQINLERIEGLRAERDSAVTAVRSAEAREKVALQQLENARASVARWREEAEAGERRERVALAKRRRAVILARERGKRLEAESRNVNALQNALARSKSYGEDLRGKLNNAETRATSFASAIKSRDAELAKVRDELDTARRSPMYVDSRGAENVDLVGRSAYHARLAIERAERAETALAAMSARCQRQQASIDDLAARFEGMVSRVTRAEAALRAAGAQVTVALPAPAPVPVAVPLSA